MAVKLRVEKAQLLLLLPASKATNNAIHPQSVDLVWLLSLAWQYPVLILSSGGKGRGKKGSQRSSGSSNC